MLPHACGDEFPAGESPPVSAGGLVVGHRLPLPCAHRGDDLPVGYAASVGLDPARRWLACGKGLTLNEKGVPGVVCPCTGCGPGCRLYEPDSEGG